MNGGTRSQARSCMNSGWGRWPDWGKFPIRRITARSMPEPFFGEGSRVILTSSISRLLPVPDAALGAFGYLLDVVAGIIGGRQRWRTMPWIVVVFGMAVGPLGAVSLLAVSLLLVIFQPVLFDAWCTLCLASDLLSLLMIGPATDAFLASLQYLKR
jgi:Vitamin K epoxide reductase family